MRYVDRADAGRRIAADVASALPDGRAADDVPLVLGIPRGGVVVAYQIADYLSADLDLALARKIGAPNNPELAIGAIGETGDAVLAHDLIRELAVTSEYLDEAISTARRELARRAEEYRRDSEPPNVTGRLAIVVDDGIATGATLRATLGTIRQQLPALLICAVPVGAPRSVDAIAGEVDVMVCPLRPRWFRAVGEWYDSFTQTTDAEVLEALDASRGRS